MPKDIQFEQDILICSMMFLTYSLKKAIGSIIGIGGMAGGIGGVLVSKLGGYLFDYYEGLGHIQTGYTIMFVLCAVAYHIAWGVMKMLVPKYSPITDL